jgi:hypothetical protein
MSRNVIPDGVCALGEALSLDHSMIVFDCFSLSYIFDSPYEERRRAAATNRTGLAVPLSGCADLKSS